MRKALTSCESLGVIGLLVSSSTFFSASLSPSRPAKEERKSATFAMWSSVCLVTSARRGRREASALALRIAAAARRDGGRDEAEYEVAACRRRVLQVLDWGRSRRGRMWEAKAYEVTTDNCQRRDCKIRSSHETSSSVVME